MVGIIGDCREVALEEGQKGGLKTVIEHACVSA